MDSQLFIGLVAILAVIYAGLAKFIQNKYIDKKRMEDYQAKMKELSAKYEKAKKSGDSKKMQAALDEQLAYMPEMNKIMFAQFKPMIYILVIFAIFSWAIGSLDVSPTDDFIINLTDDGHGCDSIAGDGTYSGCYQLPADNQNFGKWTVTATLYETGKAIGHNQTYFHYGSGDKDSYVENAMGEEISVWTDKKEYAAGDSVAVYAVPADTTKPGLFSAAREIVVDRVEAKFSNGTYFRADLPVTIPILNWSAFYQPIVWFIFISFVLNISIGLVMNAMKKKEKKAEEK